VVYKFRTYLLLVLKFKPPKVLIALPCSTADCEVSKSLPIDEPQSDDDGSVAAADDSGSDWGEEADNFNQTEKERLKMEITALQGGVRDLQGRLRWQVEQTMREKLAYSHHLKLVEDAQKEATRMREWRDAMAGRLADRADELADVKEELEETRAELVAIKVARSTHKRRYDPDEHEVSRVQQRSCRAFTHA
jgi:hypothetical protein